MENKFGKECVFLVASDSLNEAMDMFNSTGLTAKYNVIRLHGDAGTDLATLSMTQHVIMSGGTYGFWAAWLAGGTTIYYSNFARNGTRFHEHFCPSCFYPPEWVALNESDFRFSEQLSRLDI